MRQFVPALVLGLLPFAASGQSPSPPAVEPSHAVVFMYPRFGDARHPQNIYYQRAS